LVFFCHNLLAIFFRKNLKNVYVCFYHAILCSEVLIILKYVVDKHYCLVPKYLILRSLATHGSPSSLRHRAISPAHNYFRPPIGVVVLHSLFLYSDTLPSRPSSFQLAQAVFQPNLYLFNYPSNLVPVFLPAYTNYAGRTYEGVLIRP